MAYWLIGRDTNDHDDTSIFYCELVQADTEGEAIQAYIDWYTQTNNEAPRNPEELAAVLKVLRNP